MSTYAAPAFESTPSVPARDVGAIEVTLVWGDNVLAAAVVPHGHAVSVGEDPSCTFFVPADRLGDTKVELVRWELGAAVVVPPAGSTVKVGGSLQRPGLVKLSAGSDCEVFMGNMVVKLRGTEPLEKVAKGFLAGIRAMAFGQVGASALVHLVILGSLAYAAPALGSEDASSVERDNLMHAHALLVNSAEREEDAVKVVATGDVVQGPATSSGGGRAASTEGAMGQNKPTVTAGRWSAAGNAKPGEETLPRERAMEEAMTFGFVDLLGTQNIADLSKAPAVPWGDVLNGAERENHLGNLWAGDVGDAFGIGLGLSGTGEGGGCKNGECTGIGVNDVGGLGHSLEKDGAGGPACPPGMPCIGHGTNHTPPGHEPHGPTMRPAGPVSVNGHLPAEVIQRIVRQNFGRFRQCYEAGLRTNPALAGRVAVKFIIDRHGGVSTALDGGSDVPDQSVVGCVVRNFATLSFPEPQNGTVTVTYPLSFSPAE